jgi:predicted nucleic acid-binding protein
MSDDDDDPGSTSAPMDLVVDAGVALKWYVPEPFEAEAKRLLDPACALHVPELFFAEFGDIVWKKARLLKTPELTVVEGREILDRLAAVPMAAYPVAPLLEAAYDLATGPARSTVDECCDLALAIALGCRFVTADQPFHDAHRDGPFGRDVLWVADPYLR